MAGLYYHLHMTHGNVRSGRYEVKNQRQNTGNRESTKGNAQSVQHDIQADHGAT